MFKKGVKCTISPDNHLVYEIIDIKTKKIVLSIEGNITEISSYFADLKEINGNSIIYNISIYNINVLEQ